MSDVARRTTDSHFALVIIVVLFAIAGCSQGAPQSVGGSPFVAGDGATTFITPEDRQKAPTIKGVTLSGEVLQPLAGLSVINVWASWCAPCRAEAPTLQALADKYTSVTFVGLLTRDDEDSARAFLRRFKITYPSLHDDSLILKFGTILPYNAIPSTVIIDKSGRVAARISGEVTVAGLSKILDEVLVE